MRAYGLWDFINGVCLSYAKKKADSTEKKQYPTVDHFKLYPTRAGLFCHASKSTIERTARLLVKLGWLEIISPATDGRNGMGVYRVVRHKEWVRKHSNKSCVLRAYDENREPI
jgi:hypothetical protein